MRARLFAFLILLLFVGIPAGVYYYFTTQNIASIDINAGTGSVFSVQMEGTFGVDGLPLADRALSYKQSCISVCRISPVLPARYTITLTASGKTTLFDTIIVNTADAIVRSYQFHDDIIFDSAGHLPGYNQELMAGLIDNAKSNNIGEFIPIGNDITGRAWVTRKRDNISQVGILSTERFTPVENITSSTSNTMMDLSQSVVIVYLAGSKTLLIPIDLSGSRQITLPQGSHILTIHTGKRWYIRTDLGSYELSDDQLIEDIRFTDSIDLSESIRLGYIDKNDTAKLSLSNLPLGQSVLVRLDRTKGESTILRSGLDIGSFLLYTDKPAYMSPSGEIFAIQGK